MHFKSPRLTNRLILLIIDPLPTILQRPVCLRLRDLAPDLPALVACRSLGSYIVAEDSDTLLPSLHRIAGLDKLLVLPKGFEPSILAA